MKKSIQKLRTAISELDMEFSDFDEVHSFEVQLDSFSSALEIYLNEEDPGVTDDIYEYDELLKLADCGEEAIFNLSKLLELVVNSDYGTSMFTEDDVDNVNHLLSGFHGALEQWFKSQISSK